MSLYLIWNMGAAAWMNCEGSVDHIITRTTATVRVDNQGSKPSSSLKNIQSGSRSECETSCDPRFTSKASRVTSTLCCMEKVGGTRCGGLTVEVDQVRLNAGIFFHIEDQKKALQ